MSQQIELLAPAGDLDAAKSGLLAGATAVFCGIDRFNARQRAKNMSLDDLRQLVSLARGRSARVYVTLNTLFLQEEIDTLAPLLDEFVFIGIDAVIVQDYGLFDLIQRHFPQLEVHASTQTNLHNKGQITFLKEFGVTQINLARELSLEEMAPLVTVAHEASLHVEVFVHGAYCVSFSGQCYMSSALTNLAGNRGSCVQTCRRQYQTEKGELRPMNLKDNSAIEYMDELTTLGVDSLKIEGRIKGNRYVYTTVKSWRDALDAGSSAGAKDSLATVYNRDFSAGYLGGAISRDMLQTHVDDLSLKEVGIVRQYSADIKELTLMQAVDFEVGDELHLYGDDKTFICRGIVTSSAHNRYGFRIEDKLMGKIKHGQKVFKNCAKVSDRWLLEQIATLQPQEIPLSVVLSGSIGAPLRGDFTVAGKTVTVFSEKELMTPQNRPLTLDAMAEKIGKLGGTPFVLAHFDGSALPADIFIPLGELNEMRRQALVHFLPEKQETHFEPLPAHSFAPESRSLVVLVDDATLVGSATPGVTYAYELPADMSRQKAKLQELFATHPHLVPWSPSVLIDHQFDEQIAFLESLAPKLIFTDNTGIAQWARDNKIAWQAGPILNVTNRQALAALSSRGAVGAVVGLDLSQTQLAQITPVEGMATIYPLIAPQLLMTSRTCLVRSSAGCHKDVMDAACLFACNRSADLKDEHKRDLVVVKQPGHYNRLYMKKRFFCPDVLRDLPNHFETFLIDLREGANALPFEGSIDACVVALQGLVAGDREQVKVITQFIGRWENNQYYEGLK